MTGPPFLGKVEKASDPPVTGNGGVFCLQRRCPSGDLRHRRHSVERAEQLVEPAHRDDRVAVEEHQDRADRLGRTLIARTAEPWFSLFAMTSTHPNAPKDSRVASVEPLSTTTTWSWVPASAGATSGSAQ